MTIEKRRALIWLAVATMFVVAGISFLGLNLLLWKAFIRWLA